MNLGNSLNVEIKAKEFTNALISMAVDANAFKLIMNMLNEHLRDHHGLVIGAGYEGQKHILATWDDGRTKVEFESYSIVAVVEEALRRIAPKADGEQT